MHELLLCVALFAVLETRNQDVLLWGKAPTPVQKLCTLHSKLAGQQGLLNSLKCTLLAVCTSNHRVSEVSIIIHVRIAHASFPIAATRLEYICPEFSGWWP